MDQYYNARSTDFSTAIQNYRQSTGSVAQSMFQSTTNQLEGQEQMSETKAQILSAASNADQSNKISSNMGDTLDKLGIDLGVKEVGSKILPYVSKKLASKASSMKYARETREGQRIKDRASNDTSTQDAGSRAAADSDAGQATKVLRPSTNGGAATGTDSSLTASGATDVNIAKGAASGGDSTVAGGNVFDALRGSLQTDDSGLVTGFTRMFGSDAGAALGRGVKFSRAAQSLARGKGPNTAFDADGVPNRLSFRMPSGQDDFGQQLAPRSVRSSGATRGATSDIQPAIPRPTALSTDPVAAAANKQAALDAKSLGNAGKGDLSALGSEAESSFADSALSITAQGIGGLASLLGPAAAIYGVVEGALGLIEDSKLEDDGATDQANKIIGRAQVEQQGLSADISADQFASKVGAGRPSFGSLAAPSLDTSSGQAGGAGGGHF